MWHQKELSIIVPVNQFEMEPPGQTNQKGEYGQFCKVLISTEKHHYKLYQETLSIQTYIG